ncbi:MAG: hypothetical protein QMB61_07780 [Clostridiaceae bacterium]
MLQKLEQKRTPWALLLILSSLALAGSGWLFTDDTLIRGALLFLGTGTVMVALIYRIFGLAKGIRWLLYWVLLLLGIGFSLVLDLNHLLPTFLGDSGSTTITNIVFIPLMLFLPPAADRWITHRLTGETPIALEEIRRNQEGMKTRPICGVDYETHQKYKAMTYTVNQPGNLLELTGPARILRIFIASLTMLLSVGLIIFGGIRTDSPFPGHAYQAVWIVGIGFCLLFSSIFLLDQGYLKSLLILSLCILLLGILYGIVELLIRTWQSSLPLFVIIVLLAGIFFSSVVLLLRQYSVRRHGSLMRFEQNGTIHRVDPFLQDTFPIKHYQRLCRVTLSDLESAADPEPLHHRLALFSNNHAILLAGSRQDPAQKTLTILLYCKTEAQVHQLQRWLKRTLSGSVQFQTLDDTDWTAFHELLPSDRTKVRLINEMVLFDLEEAGEDLTDPKPVIFSAAFAEQEPALAFLRHLRSIASEQSFDQAIYVDNTAHVRDHGLAEKFSHAIEVQKTFRISKAWLDIEALKFLELVTPAGGTFETLIVDEVLHPEDDDHPLTEQAPSPPES